MPETLIKKIGKRISIIAAVGMLLYGSFAARTTAANLLFYYPCNKIFDTYKVLPISSIQAVDATQTRAERKPVDYSELSWQEAIEYVQTPEEAQDYLDNYFEFKPTRNADSFALNYTDRKGDCIDYAIAAAALLSDNGFTPNFLDILLEDERLHAVYVYKTDSGYGILGNTPVEPVFQSIDSLVIEVGKKVGQRPRSYKLVDLNSTFPNNQWIDGTRDLQLPMCTMSDYTALISQ